MMSIGSFYAMTRDSERAKHRGEHDRRQPQYVGDGDDMPRHHDAYGYGRSMRHDIAPHKPHDHHHHHEDDGDEDDERYELTKAKAEQWIDSLESEDPAHPHGARWTMDEVRPFAQKYGYQEGTEDFIEFWAAMNMLYSDYYGVFREYNLTTPEAFAKMARAFLHDKDAMDHKLGRYYTSVVRK